MDSVPRLVFGKASLDGAIRRMPVGVEAHHALVDGLDVARFFERFEAALTERGLLHQLQEKNAFL